MLILIRFTGINDGAEKRVICEFYNFSWSGLRFTDAKATGNRDKLAVCHKTPLFMTCTPGRHVTIYL